MVRADDEEQLNKNLSQHNMEKIVVILLSVLLQNISALSVNHSVLEEENHTKQLQANAKS